MASARPSVRLFVEDDLAAGGTVGLAAAQSHYLHNVMRLGRDDEVAVFNGCDGEWRARIDGLGRGWCSLSLTEPTAPQTESPDLWLVFAPVKRARLDFIAGKATELGVSALWPLMTRHTSVSRVNTDRLRANAIEAAEQCGRMDVPEVMTPAPLADALAAWPTDRRVLLCDETGGGVPVAQALSSAPSGPWAVMAGPEGGFARDELDALAKLPFVTSVGLGPRTLRSETAALAALVCWQAWLGDWGASGSRSADHESQVSGTVRSI